MASDIDDSEFQNRINELVTMVDKKARGIFKTVANEVLRLSQNEVPIYTGSNKKAIGGSLQNSGFVEDHDDESIVGYNIVYAAYQHEGQRRDGSHVVTHYTNPRSKKKFLENPIKNNMDVWRQLGIAVLAPIFK